MPSPQKGTPVQRPTTALRARYRISLVNRMDMQGNSQSRGNSYLDSGAEGPTTARDISSNSRTRGKRLYIFFISLIFATFLGAIYTFWTTENPAISQKIVAFPNTPHPANEITVMRKNVPSLVSAGVEFSISANRPLRTVPVVDRSILERLDQLSKDKRPNHDESPAAPESNDLTQYGSQHILEDHDVDPLTTFPDICGEDISIPCRFLLPLRIAEQESKARIHLLQIIELAKRLRRLLVLPNIGKSRLGFCFKWSFESYYDEESLVGDLHDKGVNVVKLDKFLNWVNKQSTPPSLQGQLLFLGPRKHQHRPAEASTFMHEGLVVSVDYETTFNASFLPGCFNDRLGQLLPGRLPSIFVHPTKEISRKLNVKPIGENLLAALGQEDVQHAIYGYTDDISSPLLPALPLSQQSLTSTNMISSQSDVLILDWDLRHPIFTSSPLVSMQYSPALVHLADLLAPSSPYLMIHWRMETVPPEALPNCAHSLIDTLSTLSHTPTLTDGIRKVWFASDFPYPVSLYSYPDSESPDTQLTSIDKDKNTESAYIRKSGTFKDIRKEHKDAVEIFLGAFRDGGKLDRWEVTDLSSELVRLEEGGELNEMDSEFVGDSGVLGILDKMVGMRASLFVSGAKGCGRKSSFTKQVVDARKEAKDSLRNVVEYFG